MFQATGVALVADKPDPRGSLDALASVQREAEDWRKTMRQWSAEARAFVPPQPGASRAEHGRINAEHERLKRNWAADADAMQEWNTAALATFNAAVSNLELATRKAEEWNARTAELLAKAREAKAAGDNEAAQGYADLAEQAVTAAEAYEAVARMIPAPLRAARDAYKAAQEALREATADFRANVEAINEAAGTNWGTIAIVIALILGGAAVATGVVSRR